MSPVDEASELMEMTAVILSAYVSNSTVQPADLTALAKQVHQALAGVPTGAAAEAPEAGPPAPTVPMKKSILPDYMVCLERPAESSELRPRRHDTPQGLVAVAAALTLAALLLLLIGVPAQRQQQQNRDPA
jgi:predicted transcriptional regulator